MKRLIIMVVMAFTAIVVGTCVLKHSLLWGGILVHCLGWWFAKFDTYLKGCQTVHIMYTVPDKPGYKPHADDLKNPPKSE